MNHEGKKPTDSNTLNKAIKYGLITTALIGIGYGIYRASVHAVNGITLKVADFGLPKIANGVVSLPIIIEFNNSTPLSLAVDSVVINLAYKQGNNYVQAGTLTKERFTVQPGTARYTIDSTIDLRQLFSNFFSTITNALMNKSIDVKADVMITIKGFTASDSIIKNIPLTSSSLGMVPNGKRTVTPVPAKLLALVPKPSGNNENIKPANADPVNDTLPLIKKLVKIQRWQGEKLGKALKGKTVEETVRNDWNFFFDHIQYKQDEAGKEQVRSLRRTVHGGFGDCDDYACSLSVLLTNQGIDHKLRIAKYNGSPDYSHIYIIVPTGNGKYLTLDPVVHQYNYEVPFTDKKDFNV